MVAVDVVERIIAEGAGTPYPLEPWSEFSKSKYSVGFLLNTSELHREVPSLGLR